MNSVKYFSTGTSLACFITAYVYKLSYVVQEGSSLSLRISLSLATAFFTCLIIPFFKSIPTQPVDFSSHFVFEEAPIGSLVNYLPAAY